MSLFDSSAPGITVLTDVPFPATIISGPGITINKNDPTAWEMSLDYAPLAEDTTLTPSSNYYTAVLDTSNGNYEKIRLDHFINQIQTIDQRSGIGDADYAVAIGDRYVALTTALTAVRNLTLPAAASVAPGHAITFQDEVGGLSNTHYWIIHTSGSDTLNGASNRILSRPYAGVRLICDGVSKWTLDRTTGMSAPTTNYAMTPDDTSVGFGTLTGPVTATLPLAASVPPGKSVTVLDLLGTCSSANTITVARSGSDTINGVPAPLTATLNAPFFFITLQSDGISRWSVVGGGTQAATSTIVSTQISDSTAVGRAVLTAVNAGAAQTAIGASAVGASVFTAANAGAAQTAIGAGTTGAAVFVATTPAAAQTALGLGTMATQAANNVNITGGTIAGTQHNNNPIVGGTIDNTPIGGTTPAAARFNSLTATAGAIDGTTIGGTTPAAGSFTNLSANGGTLGVGVNILSLRGYLAGLGMIWVDASHITVNPGVAISDDNTTTMTLPAAITKTLATWALGTGGMLDTGAATGSSWYHIHLIERTDTGVVDVLASLSPTAPTLPASYSKKRRLGSIWYNATPVIVGFVQNGDHFDWTTPTLLQNAALGTSAAVLTSVGSAGPPGIIVEAKLNGLYQDSAANIIWVSSPLIPDQTPSVSTATAQAISSGGFNVAWNARVFTNSSGQVRMRQTGTTGTLTVTSLGWIDTRGRFN
jgi:hypothetical protein